MPRAARLDTPGVLQHVMIRGIERRKIFRKDGDREDMLERLGVLLPETGTACYAWTFLDNHAHFLFRSGPMGIAVVMRRLLTGYVVSFNHRQRRSGQLFQNRYKWDSERVLSRAAAVLDVPVAAVRSGGRHRPRALARGLTCYWAVRELGMTAAVVARRLGMTAAGANGWRPSGR